MLEAVDQDSLRTEFLRHKDLLLADYHYRSSDVDQALAYMVRAYQAEQTQQNMFVKECLIKKISALSGAKPSLDTLIKYEVIFPFTETDPELQSYKVWYEMRLIYEHFELNESDEGLRLLAEFRENHKADDGTVYRDDAISAGFGAAASWYIRKVKVTKAKAILNEGLSYAPDSFELKRRLKSLNKW